MWAAVLRLVIGGAALAAAAVLFGVLLFDPPTLKGGTPIFVPEQWALTSLIAAGGGWFVWSGMRRARAVKRSRPN